MIGDMNKPKYAKQIDSIIWLIHLLDFAYFLLWASRSKAIGISIS